MSRRLVEKLALATLPALGACDPTPAAPVVDLGAAAPADLALVDTATAPADLMVNCKPSPDPCIWVVYVDGGASVGSTAMWTPDGGTDGGETCAPCAFDTRPDAECGGCLVLATACGVFYECSLLSCSAKCPGGGRRPEGLVAPSLNVSDNIGARWARLAHLEAASVPAFARLGRELAAHGAPERLVAGSRRALLDEVRHARIMADLARAAGARVPPVEVGPLPVRPLVEIAVENAVEGCVHEAQGAHALEALARATRDPILSDILRAVAVDESRHAALARAVDRWVRPRLTDEERARVETARRDAVR